MWKIVVIVIILTLLSLVWWNAINGNIAYLDGVTTLQIPSPLFTANQKDELSLAIKFPKDGVRDGILLLLKGSNPNDFQIFYIQNGNLILNTGNDPNKSLIIHSNLEASKEKWLRFGFTLEDSLKSFPVYFGGAPIEDIPTNTVVFEDADQISVVPFPTSGITACTNYVYLNNFNLSDLFRKQGLRTYC